MQASFVDIFGNTLGRLCDALQSTSDWSTSFNTICARVARLAGPLAVHQYSILSALSWCAAKSSAAREIRRGVARHFLMVTAEKGGNEEAPIRVIKDDVLASRLLEPIWNAISRAPAFSVARYSRSCPIEDYLEITALTKILWMAVGGLDDVKKQSVSFLCICRSFAVI